MTLLLTRIEPARMMPPRRDGTMKKRVALGTDRAAELNPLLSLVEDWMTAPGGYVEHMHRGFETVTLVFAGQVRSADTYGETCLLLPGDVQWITTGRGVLHAELPTGEAEAHQIQLWLNLPAALKLCPLRFQTVPAAQVPTVAREGLTVRVVSGTFDGVEGGAQAAQGARVLDVTLDEGRGFPLPIPSGQLGLVYVIAGAPTVGAHLAKEGDVVHFTSKISEDLPLTGPGRLLVVHAPPLAEPVLVNGPFIMNTATQIQEAYSEFRANTFAVPPVTGQ